MMASNHAHVLMADSRLVGCVLCLDHVCVHVQVRMDSGVEFDSVRIARMSGMWR